jgi:hypothetical protein
MHGQACVFMMLHHAVANFEDTPPSPCFPHHMFQRMKVGICQNTSFLLSARQLFLEVGRHGDSLIPDITGGVQNVLKKREDEEETMCSF